MSYSDVEGDDARGCRGDGHCGLGRGQEFQVYLRKQLSAVASAKLCVQALWVMVAV